MGFFASRAPKRKGKITLPLRIFACIGGAVALGLEIGFAYKATSGDYYDIVFQATVAAPILAACAFLTAERCWRDGRVLYAFMVAISAILITCVVLDTSARRLAHTQYAAHNTSEAATKAAQQASKVVAAADERIKQADDRVNHYRDLADTGVIKGDCATACKQWRKRQAEAQIELDNARAARALLPAIMTMVVSDPNAVTNDAEWLSQLLGGVPVETVLLYKPMLMPVGYNILAIFGFAIAFAPGARKDMSAHPMTQAVAQSPQIAAIMPMAGVGQIDDDDPTDSPGGGRRRTKAEKDAERQRVKTDIYGLVKSHGTYAAPQRKMADDLLTSHGTVGRSIHELESEGLLTVETHRRNGTVLRLTSLAA
jgi:hypothetical protein